MAPTSLDERICKLVASVKKCAIESVHLEPGTDIVKDLGFDSLEVTEFFYSIEDEFDIEIDYAQLKPEHLRRFENLKTFLFCVDGNPA